MVNDTYKKIGERVKHYRTNRGLSQDQLADGICSRQTISLLENGQHFPSPDFMKHIAAKLAVPFHEIMVDEAKELEAKVQLDIIKVYVETGDYSNASTLIEELDEREELLEYLRRELIMSKAECLLRTGSADQAVEILTALQQRLEDNNEPDDHFLAVLTDKLGTAYYFISQMETAYAFYMRAYQISKRFPDNDPVAAKIAFNLGKILRMIDHPNEAIDHLIRAEEYFNQVSDLKRQAITLFELGIAYQSRGNLEKADAIILRALALYESLNMVSMARRVRESHAYTVLSEREPTRAIEVLIECSLGYEQDGDRLNLVYTYTRIAFLLLRKGDNDRALQYLESALNLFSEGEASNNFEYVTAYHAFAEYLLQVKRFDECIQFSSKASELFAKMGLESDAADSLKLAVKAYRLQGKFEMALDLSEQIVEILHRSRNRF